MNDVDLRRVAVPHIGDVADVDHRAVHGLDWKIAEGSDERGRVVELDRVFELSDLLGSDGRDQILVRQRVRHILSREAARLHRVGVEIDLYLPRLAAVGVGDGGAWHGDERRAHNVEANVLKRLFGHARARKPELDDRHRGGVVVENQRRRGTRRHLLEQRLRDRRHLRVGDADIHVGLEKRLDHAKPVVGIGFYMIDVVDRRRQGALELRHDAAGHLIRRQARVLPNDRDDGNADVGENVDRHAKRRERPDDENDNGQHDERVGSSQRHLDEADHAAGAPEDAGRFEREAAPHRVATRHAIMLRCRITNSRRSRPDFSSRQITNACASASGCERHCRRAAPRRPPRVH